jgi:hypothetical protein
MRITAVTPANRRKAIKALPRQIFAHKVQRVRGVRILTEPWEAEK